MQSTYNYCCACKTIFPNFGLASMISKVQHRGWIICSSWASASYSGLGASYGTCQNKVWTFLYHRDYSLLLLGIIHHQIIHSQGQGNEKDKRMPQLATQLHSCGLCAHIALQGKHHNKSCFMLLFCYVTCDYPL